MKSLRTLFKVGRGPSSSHCIGPERACIYFNNKHDASKLDRVEVILYGSLALTGKGHNTDKVIEETIDNKNIKIKFNITEKNIDHENTMDIIGYKDNKEVARERIYSIGGGDIRIEGVKSTKADPEIYDEKSFDEIKEYCQKKKISLLDYVYQHEDNEIKCFLSDIFEAMLISCEAGFKLKGYLPGKLGIKYQAKLILDSKINMDEQNKFLSAYAYSINEYNATNGTVVTAPTCGACGTLPSVLIYAYKNAGFTKKQVIDALAIAGIIGNIIRRNGSISGAEAGCQAEVGSACAMAAAAWCFLNKGNLDQIESSAEIALEHHLGLTCDPILGYVQVPCIQRNALAAIKAVESASLSLMLSNYQIISLDNVIKVMKETGKDLKEGYRETSLSGLAKLIKKLK